jgi:hypothetical protein
MSQKKLIEIKALIEGAEVSLQQAKAMLASLVGDEDKSLVKKAGVQGTVSENEEGQVIEGVFDGQGMIGPDGKQYSIAANYASKSKLVEGDLLKLTIDGRGNFIYKQIGPIDRIRLKGSLSQDESSEEWRVLADGKAYKVLLASVTYFKGEAGDEAVIVVPKDKSSTWAAIENIIKAGAPSPDIMNQPESSRQDFDETAGHESPAIGSQSLDSQPSDNLPAQARSVEELKPVNSEDEFEQI